MRIITDFVLYESTINCRPFLDAVVKESDDFHRYIEDLMDK